MVEVGEEHLTVAFVREPRMSQTGQPVLRTETVSVGLDDEPTRPLVQDFLVALNDLTRDLLDATSDANTQSLDEWEMGQDDDVDLDEDLGMGDAREDREPEAGGNA
jgi:hypothetical protein